MTKLPIRLGIAALATMAIIYGCGENSSSPTSPEQIQPTTLRTQVECGEGAYLMALSPTLAAWNDSITDAFGDTLSLTGTPVWMTESVVSDYLNELAPVLQGWQAAINGAYGSALLDSIADFTPGTTSNQTYLSGLSTTLMSWEGALEGAIEGLMLVGAPAFVPDTTPPVLACIADTTFACADSMGVTFEFEVTATDDCDPMPMVTCEPTSGSRFPLGETMVTCTAADSSGNESMCTFMVTVTVAEPPVIECPGDIVIECSGEGGNVVDFDVMATSSCSDSVTVVCEPASGSEFPVGETTVTCTATDNFGNSSECSFRVTVTDTQPPVINSASASPNVLWPPNHKWVTVRLNVDADDACGGEPECTILDVTSNEAINGKGDGNTEPDWMITGGNTLKLRAERSGTGSGRIYTVHYRCDDASGNSTEGRVVVLVPHDRGGGASR
jgi:hypothetical protein